MGLDVVKKVLLQKKSQSVLNNMQILKGARPLNVPLRPKITFEYHFFTSYPIAYIYVFFSSLYDSDSIYCYAKYSSTKII